MKWIKFNGTRGYLTVDETFCFWDFKRKLRKKKCIDLLQPLDTLQFIFDFSQPILRNVNYQEKKPVQSVLWKCEWNTDTHKKIIDNCSSICTLFPVAIDVAVGCYYNVENGFIISSVIYFILITLNAIICACQ